LKNEVTAPVPGAIGNHRVLVVHNAYQQRGGEDSVVEAEVALLRQHGHHVHLYQRHNDEVSGTSRADLAVQSFWSTQTLRDVTALIAEHHPTVVHVHNTLPLVSPSVYWAAHRARVPVVQTLHNFRLLCPQALMLRDGRVCEDCVGKVPWRAVQHRCYRESTVQSAVVAGVLQGHRWLGTWQHKISRYIALNSFCRDKFIAGGLPAERISIKPNFVDLPMHDQAPARDGFLFVGRLSEEKGLATLASAARLLPADLRFRIVGTGSEERHFHQGSGAVLLGLKSRDEIFAEMRKAKALIVPSIWFETFGLVVAEAFACGTPVIASRIGALAALIEDGVTGLHFNPGNSDDLAEKLAWAQQNTEAMAQMGRNARLYYEQKLTGDVNYRQLIDIYDMAGDGARYKADA